jgi:hypothetical protein
VTREDVNQVQYERVALIVVFAAWLGIVAATMSVHEFWRDEVRAFSYARDAGSVSELLHALENDGHPVMWHALLYVGYGLTSSKLTLPLTSILIAGVAIVLFLVKAPFAWWFKALWALSILPVYEYSVMARNYGISMLLMFVFAALYAQRRRHPLVVATVIALLSNTNVHSLLLACLLAALWLWDEVSEARTLPSGVHAAVFFGALSIVLLGMGAALAVLWPTGDMIASDTNRYTMQRVVQAVVHTISDPVSPYRALIPRLPWGIAVCALVVSLGGLAIKRSALVAAAAAFLLLSVFFSVVYDGLLRHQGLFLTFLVTLYWMVLREAPMRRPPGLSGRLLRIALNVTIPLILVLLVLKGGAAVLTDVRREMSSGRSLARFLASNAMYRDAFLVGEPDYYLEALPYYVDNPIYIVREQRVGNTVRFIRSAQLDLSLDELLSAARELRRASGKEVLIAIGHLELLDDPRREDVRSLAYGYGRTFSWSSEQIARFAAQTERLQVFDKALDENFALYRVLPPSSETGRP